MLTHGIDLTLLGLPLEMKRGITEVFGGPFADVPCRPQDIDYVVPCEYLTNFKILSKLKEIKLDSYHEDLLFMLYYTNPRDVLSMACAAELNSKGWRYDTKLCRWLRRPENRDENSLNIGSRKRELYNNDDEVIGEVATFEFFNPESWSLETKEIHTLFYANLENDTIKNYKLLMEKNKSTNIRTHEHGSGNLTNSQNISQNSVQQNYNRHANQNHGNVQENSFENSM